MDKARLLQVYGETIYGRGLEYFQDRRITSVAKFRGKLIGEVLGNDRYKVEVDLEVLDGNCSCPYGTNCKHGVAVLLQYLDGQYVDGDEIMEKLDDMSFDELKRVIDKLISINPANLMYLSIYPTEDLKTNEKWVKAFDKEIKSRLKSMEYVHVDEEFTNEFANFIKVNDDALTKEQIFTVLEFLVENYEEYGCFYDDYSDNYFGDVVFENLCDAFVKKDVDNSDFEKIIELFEEDGYGMSDTFFARMASIENTKKLANFEEYIHRFVDLRSYILFLINCGLIDKARELIENEKSLDEGARFRLYLKIDVESAIEFAHRNAFYSSLMQYYHERGAHDKTVALFEETIKNEYKTKKLMADMFLCNNIFDSINRSQNKEGRKVNLRSLFEICYLSEYYKLCMEIGIKLVDKELMRKLIDKRNYYFDMESKMKLLEYLKDDYKEEVEKELKELAELLIDKKKNYDYEYASECVFLLRVMVGKEEWEEYVKALYAVHFRKINLWREFSKKGISFRKNKGIVSIV